MKTTILNLLLAILLLSFAPNDLRATTNSYNTELPGDTSALKIKLINRISEINKMDRSAMDPGEKRTLRKEARSINKTLHNKASGVYIYVSAGLLLLILILLLIIIL